MLGFGENINPSQILDLISKNNLWRQTRALLTSRVLSDGDIVLHDGALNVVQTPVARTADDIDDDLYNSGIILAGLSKSNAPKCKDIVVLGRQRYPNQPFIFPIPPDRIWNAHAGADENQMILTLGPRGRTLGLQFGIVLSTDPHDYDYHVLFISYRHNQPHREAIANGQVVKVYDSLPLTESFVNDVLIPVGARLVQYAKGVISPKYPLPAGVVHSHVLLTADDLTPLIQRTIAAMLEAGETLYHIECDRREPQDDVDVILNRFFRR